MKNRTLLFGEGLFETFRVYPGRKLAFVEDHLDRMADGCRFFGLPFSREEARQALVLALGEMPPETEARLRLNLTSYGDQRAERSVFETTWQPLQGMATHEGQGVTLGLAPFQRFSRSPLVRYKTTSYLENIFVLHWARSRGFFDALFANEHGQITEGSITNVFFFKKGLIVTPPLDAGLLPGITRRHVMEVAGILKLPLQESAVALTGLHQCDGAFVTNSVVEVLPVRRAGDAHFELFDTAERLRQGYRKRVADCLVDLRS